MAQAIETRDLLACDLREVVEELEELEELRHVDGANWNLEIGAITELLALRDGPSLMFDNIKGYPAGYRVLSNLMNSPRRVGLLFGLSQNANGITLIETIRRRFTGLEFFDPVEVPRPRFAEETQRGDDVDLLKFPSPFWHELDGGRYLGTACVVVLRDPDGGWVNVGTYRTQVHDRRTLGLFIEPSHQGALILQRYWERGETAPIAICIGVQPVVLMSGFLALPWGTSEYKWASGLIGRPIEVARGEVTGLPLPASAEIVIEGFCPPPSQESRVEGPFGETIGYYASDAAERPVIRVELVQHRHSPILAGAPPLRPPASSSASYLFRAANLWTEMERAGVPDIRGVWMVPSGSSSLLTVISIRQRYGGHAKQTAQAAMGGRAGGGQLGRFVIVVDDDIDPSDIDQVLWAVATRCEPETAIDIIRETTTHYLDPLLSPEKRAAHNYTASRAIINACRPYHWKDQFPTPVGTSPELRDRILKDWPSLFDGSR